LRMAAALRRPEFGDGLGLRGPRPHGVSGPGPHWAPKYMHSVRKHGSEFPHSAGTECWRRVRRR
jgi:hypothetical protein